MNDYHERLLVLVGFQESVQCVLHLLIALEVIDELQQEVSAQQELTHLNWRVQVYPLALEAFQRRLVNTWLGAQKYGEFS
eukprot:3954470-Amphidinium_carterae.1